MDLTDGIGEDHAPYFRVARGPGPVPITKGGPVHTTHLGSFLDGMTGRHELSCDGLCFFWVNHRQRINQC